MKKPRLTDFDPNAKVLELASPLDSFPTISRPAKIEAPMESPPVRSESSTLAAKTATEMPGNQPSNHDTTIPRHHDTKAGDLIELIRKGVRELGEKAATHRFTREEKAALQDIEYTYRKQYSWQTSENEITRIAIRWLIEDYRANGENSILHRVLEVLKS